MLQTPINTSHQIGWLNLRLLTIIFILLFTLGMSNTALAANLPSVSTGSSDTAEPADPTANLDSPEAIRAIISELSDKEVRQILIDRLDANAAAEEAQQIASESPGIAAFFKRWATGVYNSTVHSISKIPHMPAIQARANEQFIENQGKQGILRVFAVLTLALILGFLAERFVTLFTRKWRERIAHPIDPDSYRESLQLLGLRFLLDMAGLITFIIVTALVIETMQSKAADDFSFLILNNLIFFPRLMLAVSRFLLSPNRPELRIVHTDDWTAHFLHRHQFGFILLIGFSRVWLQFTHLNGVIPGEMRLGYWLNLTEHLYFIYIAWKARFGLTRMLSGWDKEGSQTSNTIAKMYPYILIFTSIFLWFIVELIVSYNAFDLLRYAPHTITMLLMLFIPVFDTFVRTAVNYMMPPMAGSGEVATNAYLSAKRSYTRIGRIILFGIALAIMAFIWQIRPHDLAARGVGANFATNMIQFLVILSIGYLIWELVTLWVNRKLAAEQTAAGMDLNAEEPGGGEGGGAGASRLSTILPLVRFTLQAIIIVMTVLIALSNIGINVTPLLAGAGVVGIAVGFGAQKLVQDVVSGIFFLIDDAFRQGEYIDIEGTLGTVEKISLRSMQLRHHRGAVHTIPYGEIPKLTNYSRDWVIMKLRFTVPFDTDLHKVKKIFKQIGRDMMEVEEFKADFLQPFKSQGVLEVNDVGIVIRGKFMAKPGTQFTIRKEIYNRVQKAFDENGLQFARKEVRVKLEGEDTESLDEQQKTQVAGAAAEAAKEEASATKGVK